MQSLIPFLIKVILWIPVRILLRVFGKFKVVGLENIKKVKNGVVFAVNHLSYIDPFLIPMSLPISYDAVFFPSRERAFYGDKIRHKIFFNETVFNMLGGYSIVSKQRNYQKSLIKHINFLKEGKSVCIFPEGTRTKDGNLGSARGGTIYLVEASNAVTVPVAISGVFKIRWKDFLTRKRQITIQFGKPIKASKIRKETKDMPKTKYRGIANRLIMKKISEMLEGEN